LKICVFSGKKNAACVFAGPRLRFGRSLLEMIHWIISFAFGEPQLTGSVRRRKGEPSS